MTTWPTGGLRTHRGPVLAAAAGVLAVLVILAGSPAGAGPNQVRAPSAESPLGTAERLLVFSVPTLSWSDLDDVDAPNLERLLDDAAIADLSVRAVTPRTSATDGYATLNAGTRAEGTPFASLAFVAGPARPGDADQFGDPTDIPPGAFEVEGPPDELPEDLLPAPVPDAEEPVPNVPDAGERYDGSPAAEEFARRTGSMPALGEVFNFGLVSLRRLNDSLLFGAEVGALGGALADGGVRRAVIANGDHGTGEDDLDFRREASVGLIDGAGVVERGRVGRSLLEAAPNAPFGTRYDNAAVATAFETFWREQSVVLVEASDMVRYEDSIPLVLESQRRELRRQAIERSDELLGRLLTRVDPSRDAVMVVAPYASGSRTDLTVIGVQAPEVTAGLLSSGTTRRDGFVQTVDVAPTILSLFGIEPPSSMEGTLMERSASGGSAAERRAFLVEADAAAQFRDDKVGPASVLFVLAQLALWVLAILALTRRRPAIAAVAQVAALGVLAYLPVTYIAGALPMHRWGSGAYWAFVLVAPAVVAIVVHRLTRRVLVDPLIAVLGLLVAFMSVDIAVGGPLQFNTVFGYTPTVAGRFNGMGNPAFAMTAAAGIILAALLAHRIGGRRGAWVAVALLGWIVVLDGAPFLGADVGGALALIPSAGVTAWMLLGLRIRARTAAVWAVGTVAVVVAFGLVDLTRPPAQQTHLGRLLADIRDNGFEAFQTVVLRKLNANLSVLTSSVWTLMVPLVFAFIAFMIWWAPWRLRSIGERIPEERAAVAGLITAMLLGFALNDSGISVPGMMIGVANASLVFLVVRIDEELPAGGPPDAVDADPADAVEDQLVGAQSSRT